MKRLGKVRKWLIALSPSDAAGLTFSREFNPRGVKRPKILDNAYVDPRHTDREKFLKVARDELSHDSWAMNFCPEKITAGESRKNFSRPLSEIAETKGKFSQ